MRRSTVLSLSLQLVFPGFGQEWLQKLAQGTKATVLYKLPPTLNCSSFFEKKWKRVGWSWNVYGVVAGGSNCDVVFLYFVLDQVTNFVQKQVLFIKLNWVTEMRLFCPINSLIVGRNLRLILCSKICLFLKLVSNKSKNF
jgi:hypothetical protein